MIGKEPLLDFVGKVHSAVADSPYFQLMRDGGMNELRPSKQGEALLGKTKTCCHVCGETGTTLFKDGKRNGEKIYICKDCKMLQALNEDDDEENKREE